MIERLSMSNFKTTKLKMHKNLNMKQKNLLIIKNNYETFNNTEYN